MALKPGTQRIRIGDILVAQQLITQDQLDAALAEQRKTGFKLGRQLVAMGLVDEGTLLDILSKQLNYPFIELKHYSYDRELVQLLPETVARRYRVVALKEEADGILLGMSDPTDIFCLDEIQKILQKPLKPAVVREADVLDILDLAYSRSSEIASLAEQLDDELEGDPIDFANIVSDAEAADTPVIKLLQKIFEEAVNNRASDIHIEPDETVLRIRQRIDGVLVEQVMNETRIINPLVVRLKLMSGLDISERRLPQDGRFHLKVGKASIDVRLSTMPVQFGESVVMRVLNRSEGLRSLDEIGMPAAEVAHFRHLITRPHGLVLVTGPTGSGKTTTLYGALAELNRSEAKIITVEDPVEYRLPRISQVQIHEKIGLDFKRVLRSSLRQDPDILLIGEIRDIESAEIALRAAMTGHLVLSTLHTNDAVTSALRLIDMGVDSYLVASNLRAVVAQRLLRRVCDSCAEPVVLQEQERIWVQRISRAAEVDVSRLRKGRGCPRCFNTGYKGRVGVFELLEINHRMADALRDKNIVAFNRAATTGDHYRPLRLSALELALDGQTSIAEVMRITSDFNDAFDQPSAPEVDR